MTRLYKNHIKKVFLTAAFMALRLIFLIMSTSILTLTTSPIELTDAIERLLKPMGKRNCPLN